MGSGVVKMWAARKGFRGWVLERGSGRGRGREGRDGFVENRAEAWRVKAWRHRLFAMDGSLSSLLSTDKVVVVGF